MASTTGGGGSVAAGGSGRFMVIFWCPCTTFSKVIPERSMALTRAS
jgi:hypothetical protein